MLLISERVRHILGPAQRVARDQCGADGSNFGLWQYLKRTAVERPPGRHPARRARPSTGGEHRSVSLGSDHVDHVPAIESAHRQRGGCTLNRDACLAAGVQAGEWPAGSL